MTGADLLRRLQALGEDELALPVVFVVADEEGCWVADTPDVASIAAGGPRSVPHLHIGAVRV